MNINVSLGGQPIAAEVRTVDTKQAAMAVIQRKIAQLEQAKKELKELKEQEKNILNNDSELSGIEVEVQSAQKKQKVRKAQVNATSEMQQVQNKKSQASELVRELKEDLSNSMYAFVVSTGQNTIVGLDGETEYVIEPKVSVKAGQLKLF